MGFTTLTLGRRSNSRIVAFYFVVGILLEEIPIREERERRG